MSISNGGIPKYPAVAAEPSTNLPALQTSSANPSAMARNDKSMQQDPEKKMSKCSALLEVGAGFVAY
jgi:hypothetical protein